MLQNLRSRMFKGEPYITHCCIRFIFCLVIQVTCSFSCLLPTRFLFIFCICLFTGARKDLCDLWQTCKKLTLFFVLWRSKTSFCIWESFQYVKTFFCNISSFFFVSAESGAELVFILEKFCETGAKLVIQE